MKLPKVYEPDQYESDIYALWEKAQAFSPKGEGKPYSIVVPPPNANGNLHIGHALTLAVQDIAVRYRRLQGDRAVLIPGADHAGFETQVVYERELAKQGKSRFDFTREELYSQIYDFVGQNRDNYESQFRQLGAGVDWSRLTFTLDTKVVRRAYDTFKKMWDEGLIYRGERLVNYCTFHGTAFADIEVEYKEEKSHLWYIRYPLTDGSGELIVATTRPETMFGDTAVAVHPDDERHKNFIGKTVKLPLTNREIPVIADDFVEIEFGTGAVKITPAHDPNDFEAGKRHDLPMPSVITNEGTMAANVPEAYRGLPVLEARAAIAEELQAQGFLTKTEEYVHNVGHCYKCGTVIQPLLRDQWFVDMQPLAEQAIKTLEAGEITFYPLAKQEQLVTYLHNLRDWNISRQIAWGIPIPAFQNVDDKDDWIYNEQVAEEILEIDGKTYRRDPDVFDTWFSSSSWPYSTLNYGEADDSDFQEFYPLSLMETGFDILYPWVSRMLMLGLYITGEIPFKSVYLHGLVLDEHGQKMSKSKGNVVNPIDIVDEYGSDALRMGIIMGTSAGNNQPFGLPKVIGARNFCNKLWNIARYIEDKTSHHHIDTTAITIESDADAWLLMKLQQTSESIAAALDDYRFSEAYDTLYHFVWDDFADWYIEASKAQPNTNVLAFALEGILKMAHPFAPFVTETIWQTLAWQPDTLLATSQWPVVPPHDTIRAAAFEGVKELVVAVRQTMKNVGVTTAKLEYNNALALRENSALVQRLAHVSALEEITGQGRGLKLTQTSFDCWLDLDSDTIKKYTAKLKEQAKETTATISRLEGRLANKSYVANAPENLVKQTRTEVEEAKRRLAEIKQEIARIP